MPVYRNVKTGVTVFIKGTAKGDWELVPDSLSSAEKPAPAEKKKKASKPKKK